MIYFNMRKKLEEEYYIWLKSDSDIKDCPFNVITFLQAKGYLNEEKIIEKYNILH